MALKHALLLFLFAALIGCENTDWMNWTYTEVPAKVAQVRILQNGKTIVRDDNNPVAGAAVGALLFGPLGAVAGAAVGSGEKSTTQTNELKGCELFLQTADGKIHKFLIEEAGQPLTKCALSEVGDATSMQLHQLRNSKTVQESYVSWEWRVNSDRKGTGVVGEPNVDEQ